MEDDLKTNKKLKTTSIKKMEKDLKKKWKTISKKKMKDDLNNYFFLNEDEIGKKSVIDFP
jgi:hypothetical protein